MLILLSISLSITFDNFQARGRVLHKLADLMDQHFEELAALETLDNGKPLQMSKIVDMGISLKNLRVTAGMLVTC